MSDPKPIEWRTNYTACFRPLAAKQEDAIEDFLQANITGLVQEELNRAVANLCDTWDMSFQKRVPNVNDIKIRILTLRKRRGEHSAATYGVKIGQLETDLRRQIAVELDPHKRFDLVCEGEDGEMCQRLELYAKALPGGMERPTYASIREIVGNLAGDLKEKSQEVRSRADL